MKKTILAAMTAPSMALTSMPCMAMGSYFCEAQKSTGFSWNGTDWAQTNFRVQDENFVLRELKEGERLPGFDINAGIFKLGSTKMNNACVYSSQLEIVRCHIAVEVIINLKTLRFLQTYGGGYIGSDANNKDTPTMTIGKCVPL